MLRKIVPAHNAIVPAYNASWHEWYVIVLFLCMEVFRICIVFQNFRSKVIVSFYDSVGAVSFFSLCTFIVCNFCITLCPIKFATTIPVGTTQSRNLVAVNTEQQQQNLVFGVRYRWNPTRATIKRIERQKSSSNCKRCPVSWFGHFDYYKHSSFLIRRKCSVHCECFIWRCLLIYKYTTFHLTNLNH